MRMGICFTCRRSTEVMQAYTSYLRHMRPLPQYKVEHDVLWMHAICSCLGGLPHLIEPDV